MALAVAACLAWVPFVGRSLSPDEGGYLLVAAQWGPGSSLYGDLWVDRPPVLIALFALADALGGATALRLMGVVVVGCCVLLAAAVGRLAVPGSRAGVLLPAGTAAVFLATPLMGGTTVDGEVLGLPFVLAGCAAALAAVARRRRTAGVWAWALTAGTCAALAVLVKQNLIDVVVVVLVLVAVTWRSARGAAVRLLVGGLAGGLVTGVLVLAGAAALGTGPLELWNAVVVFRGQAGEVIHDLGPGTNRLRLAGLVTALAGSGAVLVGVLLAWGVATRPSRADAPDLRWPAAALVVWEIVGVLGGGSFWLHYLLGLVPGLVLLAAARAQRPLLLERGRRPLRAAYTFAALSALAATAFVIVRPIPRAETPVMDYLHAHARPGESAVVAFGGANILADSHLVTPYEHLWSLPVRVRDPQLRDFTAVLAGPERPLWVVVSGRSLGSWSIDPTLATPYLKAEYAEVARAGRFRIYRLQDAP